MKYLFHPATFLFFGLWLLLLLGGRERFFYDPGTFWHTVIGEQVLTTRGFFDTDEFTFTFYGQQYIPHQWFGSMLLTLFHRLDRLDSLLLYAATLLATVYTLLGARLMRAGIHWSVAIVLVAFAMSASTGHFHVRPHLLTMAFLAILMSLLTDYEAGRCERQRLFWLIPLFVVWVNSHGGVLGGFGTFGFVVAGWAVCYLLKWWNPFSGPSDLWLVGGILVVCMATSLVNPWLHRMPLVWLDIYQSDLPTIIKEHSPLDLTERTGITVVAFGILYLLLFLSTWPQKPRVVWLIPLIWFVLACSRVRHAPLFAITALVAIADMFPYTRLATYLENKQSDLYERQPDPPYPPEPQERWLPLLLPMLAFLVALGLQITRIPVPVIGHGWARLDPKIWPVDLIDDLKKYENIRPEGTLIFNEYIYGGFLIYYTPGIKVFVDDRCEVFGDQWLKDFVLADQFDTADAMRIWQQDYGRFDLALTTTGSGFDLYFRTSPYWFIVRETETATLYQRE